MSKWLEDRLGKDSTRKRSAKQEKRVAKTIGGRTTINSGATFGENDVVSDTYEVEAKTTTKKSFPFKLETFEKLRKNCHGSKIPLMVVAFEEVEKEFVIMDMEDAKFLLNNYTSA